MISYFPNNDWLPLLKNEFSKPYFIALQKQLNQQVFFPAKEDLFKAFALCSFATCKVVILGQDPYHDEGQAHGLAFSVPNTIKTPPSLQNIFKELNKEYQQVRSHNDLSDWAQQGVLLLNTHLSVSPHQALSHKDLGWELFTDQVIQALSANKEHLVFLLWGKSAQAKAKFIDAQKHLIIKTAHPSPLSAYRGFLGSNQFKMTNLQLTQYHLPNINWFNQ